MDHPPASRVPGLALLLASVTAIALFAAGTTWALRSAADQRAGESAAQRLTDDDGDRPLFTLPRLAPGERVSRCIKIRHEGAEDLPISLTGAGSGGSLAGMVDLQIDTGAGGGYNDCAGFSGTPLFRGTLQEFHDRSAATEIGLVAYTSRPELRERTFRFTVELRDTPAATGQTSQMAFTWLAGATRTPPAAGASTTASAQRGPVTVVNTSQDTSGSSLPGGGTPKADDATTPSVPTAATPDEPAAADRAVATRGPAGKPAPTARPSGPELPRTGPVQPVGAARDDKSEPSIVERVATAAKDIAVRAAFPLLLAIIAGLFLLVQHRLDARDPKLALAPVHRDPDLAFGPVPPPGEPA